MLSHNEIITMLKPSVQPYKLSEFVYKTNYWIMRCKQALRSPCKKQGTPYPQ